MPLVGRTGASGRLRISRLNSGPSSTSPDLPLAGRRMPHLTATERAVLTLSPVTMRTVMPARWHCRIDAATCAPAGRPIYKISYDSS